MSAPLLIQRDGQSPAHYVQPNPWEDGERISLCGLFEAHEVERGAGGVRFFRGHYATCSSCIQLAAQFPYALQMEAIPGA